MANGSQNTSPAASRRRYALLPMREYINYLAFICFLQTSAFGQSSEDSDFLKSKGTWPSPIDRIVKIDTRGVGITIQTDSNRIVRSVQPGQVAIVTFIGDDYAVIVRNNNYFISYSNLKSTSLKKSDYVKAGQEIGILAGDNDQLYELDISLYCGDKAVVRIQDWFSKDFRRRVRIK